MSFDLDLTDITSTAWVLTRFDRIVDTWEPIAGGASAYRNFKKLCQAVRYANFQAQHHGQIDPEPFIGAQVKIAWLARMGGELAIKLAGTSRSAEDLKLVGKALLDHADSADEWLKGVTMPLEAAG